MCFSYCYYHRLGSDVRDSENTLHSYSKHCFIARDLVILIQYCILDILCLSLWKTPPFTVHTTIKLKLPNNTFSIIFNYLLVPTRRCCPAQWRSPSGSAAARSRCCTGSPTTEMSPDYSRVHWEVCKTYINSTLKYVKHWYHKILYQNS